MLQAQPVKTTVARNLRLACVLKGGEHACGVLAGLRMTTRRWISRACRAAVPRVTQSSGKITVRWRICRPMFAVTTLGCGRHHRFGRQRWRGLSMSLPWCRFREIFAVGKSRRAVRWMFLEIYGLEIPDEFVGRFRAYDERYRTLIRSRVLAGSGSEGGQRVSGPGQSPNNNGGRQQPVHQSVWTG